MTNTIKPLDQQLADISIDLDAEKQKVKALILAVNAWERWLKSLNGDQYKVDSSVLFHDVTQITKEAKELL